MPFIKLSATPEFTVKKYLGRKYKKWDDEAKKMLSSDTYQEGYQLKFGLETDQGTLEVSRGNIGDMLASLLNREGSATIINKTFTVKTNGKTGIDIRYFINLK